MFIRRRARPEFPAIAERFADHDSYIEAAAARQFRALGDRAPE